MIELVVFDIAGTTVYDPDGVGRCLKAALSAAGLDCDHDKVNALMGIAKPVVIDQMLAEYAPERRNQDTIDVIFADFQSRMIEYYRSDPEVRPIEGATDVFARLHAAGIQVGLDTGFDRSVVDVLLHRLGWDSAIVDATVTSDEVAHGRPDPDLVFKLMELTGVLSSTKVCKVGDTPSDMQEGTAAQCALVVGVGSGTHTLAQLEIHPHTHLIDSIRDLPELLGL